MESTATGKEGVAIRRQCIAVFNSGSPQATEKGCRGVRQTQRQVRLCRSSLKPNSINKWTQSLFTQIEIRIVSLRFDPEPELKRGYHTFSTIGCQRLEILI